MDELVEKPNPAGYIFTVDMNAEGMRNILKLATPLDTSKPLTPQETKQRPDTLVVTCTVANNDPDLRMRVTDPTGKDLPVSAFNLSFRFAVKFDLVATGLRCKLGAKHIIVRPGTPEEWEAWYTPDKTLTDLLAVSKQKAEAEQEPEAATLPLSFPQRTFEEARALGFSLADSSTLRYWNIDTSATATHKRPGDRHEIKFDPATLPEVWSGTKPGTPDAVKEFLKERGWKGMLTAQLAMSCAILRPDEPIPLDEFVKCLFDIRTGRGIGKPKRTDRQPAADWNTKRVWVWETLCAIFNMQLYGARAGVYKDPQTKTVIDLVFRGEPLIAPSPGTKTFANGQQKLWPDDIPVTCGFTMGKWGKEARKNPKALQYFGDLCAIFDIPGGKRAGAWAQCILYNLNQQWREKAKDITKTPHTRTDAAGNDRKVIAIRWPNAFTRRELLVELAPPDQEHSVTDLLNSNDPSRAKRYWNAAIKILQTQGSISYYKELAPLDSRRQGWADEWLDQPLDIRPNKDGRKAAIEIREAHKKALAARKRKTKSGDQKRESRTSE